MLDKIKKYRIVSDLKWAEVAEMIGMEETYLKLIAGGHMKPGPKTEFKIARFYNEHRDEIDSAVAEYDSMKERATA